jgi:hypothetical protein
MRNPGVECAKPRCFSEVFVQNPGASQKFLCETPVSPVQNPGVVCAKPRCEKQVSMQNPGASKLAETGVSPRYRGLGSS